ncbi:pol polyprotein [Tanacetum coccineum]
MFLDLTTLALRGSERNAPQVELSCEGQSSNAQDMQAVEAWNHSDILCHNLCFDGLIVPFVVAWFLDYKLVDSTELWSVSSRSARGQQDGRQKALIHLILPKANMVELAGVIFSWDYVTEVPGFATCDPTRSPCANWQDAKAGEITRQANMVDENVGHDFEEAVYGQHLQLADIKGVGRRYLMMTSEKGLKLTNVLYVSEIRKNLNQMYVGKGYAVDAMFKLNVMVVKNDINKMNSSAYLIESSNVWHGSLGTCIDFVYLLKVKLKLLDMFVLYKTEVENKLGRKIKVVRSDRGGEYVSPFAELCAKHGIRHEFTVPYSPLQKNLDKEMEETLMNYGWERKPSFQFTYECEVFSKVAVPISPRPKIGPKYVVPGPDFAMQLVGLSSLHWRGAISWKSSKQTVIAMSSIESEFIALDNAEKRRNGLTSQFIGALRSPPRELRNELKCVQNGVRLSSPAVQQLWTLYPGKQTANLF